MTASRPGSYDPRTFKALTFHDATARFRDGSDCPRAYLERCLATVAEREPVVKAFANRNDLAAREAADASTARWRSGRPLSPIDGMPVGIKDLLETKDMPTEMGCAAYRGNFPKRDNAAVWALRQAGAVIFGKTTTAELGGSHPPATTNPFDSARTAGGSSSGSAAAVAARMMPAAIGTQVGGSIIRPAAFCGNFALKPTQGAINRGERQATSMSTHGVHAGSIEDMWQVAIAIAQRAGGDRGCQGLFGPMAPPHALKPGRLIVLEAEGWERLDAATRSAFAALLEALERAGVALLRRRTHAAVERLERAIANATAVAGGITAWENRWATRNLVDQHPEGVSERAKAVLARAEAMTPDDYRALLLEREVAQATHASTAPMADAAITLSCPGPAPYWSGDVPGKPLAPRPTGDAVFNYPSSLLFAPCVTVPIMAVGGLPVGVQLMGQQHEDARVTGMARWLNQGVAPVVAP
jgi:Asp-tRNA(Asn)/Glu-tRNA(Gln) amidotransferase A subunit family amidase